MDLPHYTLTQKAFEGSETIVYRGRRDADGAKVAVKVTRNEYPTAQELARLRREFGILQEVSRLPGVVNAYALEKYGRGLALVMEDLGPRSLQSVIAEPRLDVKTAITLGIAIADTLDALHQLGVIHKDIKPLNIMLDEASGAPRIVDFGIAARLSQETPEASIPSRLEGTLAYISPEQTGRMNRTVDRRSDLYSLGATLYEVLSGSVPFPTKDPTEIIHCHVVRSPAPLHELSKDVPRALSDVVMRLLKKTPEERYQSARGLKADLEECLRQWSAAGQVREFPLGRHDASGELRVPQALYGREAQVEALLAAFERARAGRAELITVAGEGGVGKSALVNEIHKPIARKGGYFVRGKFDPVSRDMPLVPVARAFRDLLRQILSEPPRALEAWRARLLAAVGDSGRVLFDLIPELELVIGPQPEVAALGPTEASNRFGLLVQRFVCAFTAPAHPLCIFLDDLQWADPASLRLLGVILGDPETRHLLVVGAYRDSEVDEAHPLPSAIDEVRGAGVPVTELRLSPLDREAVRRFVADALSVGAPLVEPLAALVFDKTRGNPFFLGQFLRALHEARLVRFDAASSSFTWDIEGIRAAKVTDNVVELMIDTLRKLSPGAQQSLMLAACIGHAFELATLATIAERPPRQVAAELWEALREGLVVPVGGDYRFFEASAVTATPADEDDAAFHVVYRFLHDRVREAAYALIETDRRVEVHLSIGRLLLGQHGAAPPDDDLLEIVRHLNLGAPRIEREAERIEVAQMDLRAGRKAKASTAYQAAAGYFAAGLSLLGDAGWESAYDLCFALHVEGAESAYLSGAPGIAEALFQVALPRAETSLAKARVQNLRVVLYLSVGKLSDALRAGLDGLAALGVRLPETKEEQETAFTAGLAEAERLLGDRRIEDLLDAPLMTDPAQRAALQLLCDISLPVFAVSPSLYGPIILMQVNASLAHGHADVSVFGYMSYGFILARMLGKATPGYAFGALALTLDERLRNTSFRCKLELSFSGYLYLRDPVRAVLTFYQRARRHALEAGEFVYLATIWHCEASVQLALGVQLEEVRAMIGKGLAVVRRLKDATSVDVLTVLLQAVEALEGRTLGRFTLSRDGFDEEDFRARLSGEDQRMVAANFHICKLQLLYLHGDPQGALAAAEEADKVASSIFGSYFATRLDFYAALALLALPPADSPEEARRREEAIARRRASIDHLASEAPGNFQHQRLILDAEVAHLGGDAAAAFDLYDRAIDLAREGGFAHDEALANELCGKLYLRRGKPKLARAYMTDAHLGYLHWGALAKVEDIEQSYGHLLPVAGGDRRKSTTVTSSTLSTTMLSGATLSSLREAALVVRATQAFAGEIELAKVIERLSSIVLENAGAQRGALVLARDGRLVVEATFRGSPPVLQVGSSVPLESAGDVAQSVVLFVARTREPVVLDDAQADPRFSADPRFAAGEVRSVLCLPLARQERLTGLLYLEHGETTAAFNEARVELLELFASQAAIALENARLLADVQAAHGEVRHANERLEVVVAERTEALSRANGELCTTNHRLEVELSERGQVERERALLQGQMIEAQRARLVELSTPLIPITDHVVVMPLIGTVDAERAAQVLEAALRGAQLHRARIVILDITGMKHIDTQVVATLLTTASALRLLGAQAVLTGTQPEIARAMVAEGQRLDGLVTLGTLQSGIAYALEQVGDARLRARAGHTRPPAAPRGQAGR